MSGGNPYRLRMLAALLAMLLAMPVAASEAPGFVTGVAAANIAWSKPAAIRATMAEIAAAGFGSVRIGYKNPVEGTFRALDAAKQAGLEVLVTVPLIDGAVAAAGAQPRPKNRHFFAAYGLSQIDLARFDARLGLLLERIAEADLPVIGLEIGNEPNWSGYNGDLPVLDGGQVVDSPAAWPAETRRRVERGLDLYAATIERTQQMLAANPRLSHIRLVTAGLADINTDFIHRVGATYVVPEAFNAWVAGRGLFTRVDAIGIHLYEPLRAAQVTGDRDQMIARQLDSCGREPFALRPCWITEFGAALPKEECAPDDARRIALMQPLFGYLDRAENATRVPVGFYYDWNEDAGFSLKRCGQPTELTRNLPRGGNAHQPNDTHLPIDGGNNP
ncbi:hypothetical protein A8950_1648 [Dongia mobilis]|uniref:Glycosyl hydrolase n=1 Tax=Dongia mobilis TaxID=578943 RepID=A0A4R6WWD5_9PROT|nr:hypothetical protein [Dongia mobilis]TDQ83362.1 hypothetical protein A8950_1648 [Dongia mobilis]